MNINFNKFLNAISIQKKYMLYENINFLKKIKYKNKKYNIIEKKKIYTIPFYINLYKFNKKNYPGTKIANKFKSIITINENNKIINTKITMNSPIKYKGYTFYQTAFIEKEKKKATILTIVNNKTSNITYIACIILCLGILINLKKR
jgi:cytochrome c biogenesis protein ResB